MHSDADRTVAEGKRGTRLPSKPRQQSASHVTQEREYHQNPTHTEPRRLPCG